jgi:hypothetical protein
MSEKRKLKSLQHGMLLDAKSVMDDALPDLQNLLELIPEKLHAEANLIIDQFEDTLVGADVASDYVEKS